MSVTLSDMLPVIKEKLAEGGSIRFSPMGVSMLPLLRSGQDFVELVKAPDRLKKGELPLYQRQDGQFVMHRVRKIAADGTYLMSGDNQNVFEEVTHAQIIGVVASYTRKGRTHASGGAFDMLYRFVLPAARLCRRAKSLIASSGNESQTDWGTVKWIWHKASGQAGALALLVVLNAAVSAAGVVFALLSRNVIDSALKQDMQMLINSAVILALVAVINIAARAWAGALGAKIKARLDVTYQSAAFSCLMRKRYSAVTAFHSEEMITRLSSDVNTVSNAATSIVPSLVSMATRIIGVLIVFVALDWRFAFAFLIGGLFLFAVTRLLRSAMKKLHKRVQETDGATRSFMQDALSALLVIKVLNSENAVEHATKKLQKENYIAKLKQRTVSIINGTGAFAMFRAGYLLALVWCAVKLYYHLITAGTLTAIVQLIGQIQAPIANLSGLIPQFYSMVASAQRLIELECLESDADKDIDATELDFSGIEFDNVSFSFGSKEILNNVSLKVNAGECITFSGASGIGKTTLLKLLFGVLEVRQGRIIATLSEEKIQVDRIKNLFAFVPQGNLLLSGTIRAAVCFGREKTDAEIFEAARICCAEDFIRERGLEYRLGEKGHGLSEGQLQRLSVVRALLCNTPVLVLDEATSALDSETEKQMLLNIKALGKTVIMVSHRPYASEVCDRNLVIKNKKIEEK